MGKRKPRSSSRELLAANLARLLEERGMSEAELGLALGLSETPSVAAANLRRLGPTRWPRPELLDRLAEALQVRPADFFADPPCD